MPRGDRTGPMGMGPRTGRGAGFCGGNDSPGFANPTPQAGQGWGGGGGRRRQRGRGLGRRFAGGPANWIAPEIDAEATPAPQAGQEDEKQSLQAQLDAIKKRLDSLEPPRDNDA